MNTLQKLTVLMSAMLAMIFLPWMGSFIHYGGDFPAGYFAYPPESAPEKDGFNIYIFSLIAFCCAVVTAVYVFPQWFGFKKIIAPPAAQAPKVRLPVWFWLGLLSWGLALFFLATKARQPLWFIHWADLPLFWGFTLMLDGWAYVRHGGKSLVSRYPHELIGIGLCSISGWMIFEFLNFFVDDNWYYPWGKIIDREEFLLYACLISSGLLPLSFEWYCIFKGYPGMRHRFSYGKKLVLSGPVKTILLVLAMAGMFASGLFPDLLFFSLWLSPPVILAVVLDKIGIWTPLKPIGQGNWSPALLSALTYFVAGFCLEGQNYLSASHDGQICTYTGDPAYWQYSLPFVNVMHIFEMPLLGFYGYLPFGIYCWLWWIACATLTNIPARFLKEDPLEEL